MKRYVPLLTEADAEPKADIPDEGKGNFFVKRPPKKVTHNIVPTMGRKKGTKRVIKGWKYEPKKKKVSGKIGGKTAGERKRSSKKAWKTRKKDTRGMKIAKKRTKATVKAKKKAGL